MLVLIDEDQYMSEPASSVQELLYSVSIYSQSIVILYNVVKLSIFAYVITDKGVNIIYFIDALLSSNYSLIFSFNQIVLIVKHSIK